MKLLFWKQKRTIGSYTNKKVLLSRDSPCFFPAFLLFDETLFLQIARTARHGFHVRNHSTVLFAVWRVLYQGCGMFYTQFVNCNTWVILSLSTSTWQPLCARLVLPVGSFCFPHSTRWMYHRTVPMVDTSLQWVGVCLRGSWFCGTRLWWLPSFELGFQLWGTLSSSH